MYFNDDNPGVVACDVRFEAQTLQVLQEARPKNRSRL